jgi:hypothetical protein
MWLLIVVATLASMRIAAHMAHSRGRSVKASLWVTAILGPIAPLLLYLFGARSDDVAHAYGRPRQGRPAEPLVEHEAGVRPQVVGC